jgi:hypothetical protein
MKNKDQTTLAENIFVIVFIIIVIVVIVFSVKSNQVYNNVFDGKVYPDEGYNLAGVQHTKINGLEKEERLLSDHFVKQMKEMLIDIRKALDKEDIKFWLAGGSLLGAVRHKGFIPWDDDIDVFVNLYDYDKVVMALKKNTKYRITSYVNDTLGLNMLKIYLPGTVDGSPPFIDIFFVVNEDGIVSKCTRIKNGECVKITEKESFSFNDIYPLKKGKFEDTWFYIPNKSEKVLKKQYGESVIQKPKVYVPHTLYTWALRNKSI